ncbi:hypothetical protein DERF_001456 [Dermatophagoides farinae]|uniref:Uncharacterized protein n=1 Tax=Dermatophagoides farinae TaxID=6954 RepID=A0A922ICB0_DERFA|nr:hypothetical protein DERF_001456 [Dermatophagoides farinae]
MKSSLNFFESNVVGSKALFRKLPANRFRLAALGFCKPLIKSLKLAPSKLLLLLLFGGIEDPVLALVLLLLFDDRVDVGVDPCGDCCFTMIPLLANRFSILALSVFEALLK